MLDIMLDMITMEDNISDPVVAIVERPVGRCSPVLVSMDSRATRSPSKSNSASSQSGSVEETAARWNLVPGLVTSNSFGWEII